jgi:hypothetical protein
MRSPWYDKERLRCASDQEAGQELDIDYLGSGHQFFDQGVLDRVFSEHCRPPFIEGEMNWDRETGEPLGFERKDEGRWKCWMHVDMQGDVPGDREYAMGIDVSVGTGATNSCLCVVDRKTSEKVLEFAESKMDPARFALCALATAKWMNQAYMLWEANGPGRIFGNRILELGYRNIYWRKNEQSLDKAQDSKMIPGWASTSDNKSAVLGEYRRALGTTEMVNHSRRAIEEARFYIYAADGSIQHSKSVQNVDPTAARKNHGDLVIADALAWKGAKERPMPRDSESSPRSMANAPVGSFGYRQYQRTQAARAAQEW